MNKFAVKEPSMKMKRPGYLFHIIFFLVIAVFLISSSDIFAQARLKGKVKDLCFECHKEMKDDLKDRYVHFLYKQGKCTTCHNAHVSNIKGLMNDEVDSVCLNCHERMRKLLDRSKVHSALKEGACTDCHRPHSGDNKYLLVTGEKELCMECHEELKAQFEKPYGCRPFKEGKCSSCHNSHASTEDNMLIDQPNKLCQKCHAPGCKAGDVSISSIVKDMDCTGCHSGHASEEKGLLGPYGHTVFLAKNCQECHNPIAEGGKMTTRIKSKELCLSCHKQNDAKIKYIETDLHVKDAKNPCGICHDNHASGKKNLTKDESRICLKCHEATEKRTALMEKTLKSIKCVPVKERQCFECHIPMHSDLPLNFRGDGIEMCARCHETQHKITHPLGIDVIDPRDGGPLTCLSCHSMHAARTGFLLTHDSNRALCIQCHKM